MNNKQFQILKTIYFNTLEFRYCKLNASSLKQGKKIYRRVKDLERMGYIIVIREKGQSNLYRLTDAGLKQVVDDITYSQIFEPV